MQPKTDYSHLLEPLTEPIEVLSHRRKMFYRACRRYSEPATGVLLTKEYLSVFWPRLREQRNILRHLGTALLGTVDLPTFLTTAERRQLTSDDRRRLSDEECENAIRNAIRCFVLHPPRDPDRDVLYTRAWSAAFPFFLSYADEHAQHSAPAPEHITVSRRHAFGPDPLRRHLQRPTLSTFSTSLNLHEAPIFLREFFYIWSLLQNPSVTLQPEVDGFMFLSTGHILVDWDLFVRSPNYPPISPSLDYTPPHRIQGVQKMMPKACIRQPTQYARVWGYSCVCWGEVNRLGFIHPDHNVSIIDPLWFMTHMKWFDPEFLARRKERKNIAESVARSRARAKALRENRPIPEDAAYKLTPTAQAHAFNPNLTAPSSPTAVAAPHWFAHITNDVVYSTCVRGELYVTPPDCYFANKANLDPAEVETWKTAAYALNCVVAVDKGDLPFLEAVPPVEYLKSVHATRLQDAAKDFCYDFAALSKQQNKELRQRIRNQDGVGERWYAELISKAADRYLPEHAVLIRRPYKLRGGDGTVLPETTFYSPTSIQVFLEVAQGQLSPEAAERARTLGRPAHLLYSPPGSAPLLYAWASFCHKLQQRYAAGELDLLRKAAETDARLRWTPADDFTLLTRYYAAKRRMSEADKVSLLYALGDRNLAAVRSRVNQLRRLMEEIAPPYAQRTHVVGTALTPGRALGCVLLVGLTHQRQYRASNIVSKRHAAFPLFTQEVVEKYLHTAEPSVEDVLNFLPASYKDAFFADL